MSNINLILPGDARSDRAVVFDTETHSLIEPRVMESAWGYLHPDTLEMDPPVVQRYNPQTEIHLAALATHHILPEDVADSPSYLTFALPEDVGFVVGHNVRFDLEVAGNPTGVVPIDTLALAQLIWPDAQSHKQGALIYMLHEELGLSMSEARTRVMQSHGAGADIEMCALLYRVIVQRLAPYLEVVDAAIGAPQSLSERLAWVSMCYLTPTVMGFGKHKGLPIAQVPRSYSDWFVYQAEDPDPWYVMALTGGKDAREREFLQVSTKLQAHLADVLPLIRGQAEPADQSDDAGPEFHLTPQ